MYGVKSSAGLNSSSDDGIMAGKVTNFLKNDIGLAIGDRLTPASWNQ
jgi:hypothetical protein